MAGAGGEATLECPRCGTTYRLSSAQPPRDDATFECAKCHEVFGPGLTLDDAWRDEPDDEAFRFDDEARPPETPGRRTRRSQARPKSEERERFELDDDEEDVDDAPDDAAEDDEGRPPARRRRRHAVEAERRPPGAARFALRGLIAITLAYAVLSIWASTHQSEFQRFLGSIPVVGPGLVEFPLDPGDVALRDVHGEYEYLKSGELAFVIQGTATNLATAPLRRVRVEGRIGGAEERRHVASCTDAPADVRKMSRQVLLLMENVRETRPTVVPAGGSIFCEVVFVDPPRPVRELSLEVVSVLAG
jgi:predicted Zn finger-like uncharacterized protein